MAALKLNVGLVRHCPPAMTVKAALDTYGRPKDKSWGVLDTTDLGQKVEFSLYRTRNTTAQQVDRDSGSVGQTVTPKDDVYRARLNGRSDENGVLEVYDGSAKTIETVGEFLASLELGERKPEVKFIPLDIEASINRLRDGARKFELCSARVIDYADPEETKIEARSAFASPAMLRKWP